MEVELQLNERIKPVIGFENRFLITDNGRLFSINGKFKGTKQMNTSFDIVGYMATILRDKPHKKRIRIHQLVALHFVHKKHNNQIWVNHLDGNKLNNHFTNLEWVTPAENSKHAVRTGLHDIKGERHPLSKLTEKEIKQIFQLRENGLTHQKISDIIGKVSRRHITDIINRECWGWL